MEDETPKRQPVGIAGWITMIVLGALLIAAIVYAVHAWGEIAGASISTFGWVMLGLGVFFTLACGIGLMGLVFYSSRHNFDR